MKKDKDVKDSLESLILRDYSLKLRIMNIYNMQYVKLQSLTENKIKERVIEI